MNTRALRILAAAAIPLCLTSACAPRQADTKQIIVDYLERNMVWRENEKVFAAFALFGTEPSETGSTAYGWCLRYGFRFLDEQVIQEDAAGLPLAVFLERGRTGLKAVGYEQPELGEKYTSSVKRIFPEKYRARALGKMPPGLMEEIRDRVIPYYRGRLSRERSFRKRAPDDRYDPHRHQEDIYAYRNLKSTYQRVRIETDPEKVVRTGGGNPIVYPGGRFRAWIGVDQRRHLYFEDLQTDAVYEVIDETNDWQSRVAWKDPQTLAFDQINAVNTFGGGGDSGVHIELDVAAREIVWAVPFGLLGFPEKA